MFCEHYLFHMTLEGKFCQLDRQSFLFYTLIKEMHVRNNTQLISRPREVFGDCMGAKCSFNELPEMLLRRAIEDVPHQLGAIWERANCFLTRDLKRRRSSENSRNDL